MIYHYKWLVWNKGTWYLCIHEAMNFFPPTQLQVLLFISQTLYAVILFSQVYSVGNSENDTILFLCWGRCILCTRLLWLLSCMFVNRHFLSTNYKNILSGYGAIKMGRGRYNASDCKSCTIKQSTHSHLVDYLSGLIFLLAPYIR